MSLSTRPSQQSARIPTRCRKRPCHLHRRREPDGSKIHRCAHGVATFAPPSRHGSMPRRSRFAFAFLPGKSPAAAWRKVKKIKIFVSLTDVKQLGKQLWPRLQDTRKSLTARPSWDLRAHRSAAQIRFLKRPRLAETPARKGQDHVGSAPSGGRRRRITSAAAPVV
jgi:hypothetical protein